MFNGLLRHPKDKRRLIRIELIQDVKFNYKFNSAAHFRQLCTWQEAVDGSEIVVILLLTGS